MSTSTLKVFIQRLLPPVRHVTRCRSKALPAVAFCLVAGYTKAPLPYLPSLVGPKPKVC